MQITIKVPNQFKVTSWKNIVFPVIGAIVTLLFVTGGVIKYYQFDEYGPEWAIRCAANPYPTQSLTIDGKDTGIKVQGVVCTDPDENVGMLFSIGK